MEKRFPLPPFSLETAKQKIQLAEDAWNSQDPDRVSLAYTTDSEWRNRNEFINGRAEIVAFLSKKWQKELNYRLKKEYWAHTDNRIAVRFEYEYQNQAGEWFRAYAMKIGNLMTMASCKKDLRVSMTWPLPKKIEN